MSTLRDHVARAIQRDQETGGAGILSAEEVAALEWAMSYPPPGAPATMIAAHEQGGRDHRATIAGLLHELGPRQMRIHGEPTKIDAYYRHCADVVIAAYDEWLDERQAMRAES